MDWEVILSTATLIGLFLYSNVLSLSLSGSISVYLRFLIRYQLAMNWNLCVVVNLTGSKSEPSLLLYIK